jgi:hypothetical protein
MTVQPGLVTDWVCGAGGCKPCNHVDGSAQRVRASAAANFDRALPRDAPDAATPAEHSAAQKVPGISIRVPAFTVQQYDVNTITVFGFGIFNYNDCSVQLQHNCNI